MSEMLVVANGGRWQFSPDHVETWQDVARKLDVMPTPVPDFPVTVRGVTVRQALAADIEAGS